MAEIDKDLSRLNADFFDEEGPEGQSNPEIAEQEVDFILKKAGLAEGAHVLDVPCGEGHHSQVLAEKYGLSVTGIDGGANLIQRAGEKYKKPNFVNAYFEDLAGNGLVADESQDAVMCINTSFGYLPTVRENEKFLSNMYAKVKPGGVVAIHTDYVPRNRIAEKIPTGETRQYGSIVYFDENDGPPIDSKLPEDYELSPEDERFRDLEITNSASVREDGSYGPRKKYAYYLAIKDDGNSDLQQRKPLDIPALRSLAQHAGIANENIQFHAEPYFEGKQIVYRCMMTFRKPSVETSGVQDIRGSVRNALGQE